ncbi:hypothetical protein BGZ58_005776 [Dissophora ornata]|nr:hypothetical protein BGZ58_005776 [Dissophora ornata]
MNPHSLSEAFLTIDDLFFKAARPHYSSATSSSSPSPSSSAHKHGRILSFVGQVVHSISATNLSTASPSSSSSSSSNTIRTTYTNANAATSLSIPVDHEDPDRFPLHRQALWLFQKKCEDKPLDHVVWLALVSNDTDYTVSLEEGNLQQGQLYPNKSRSRSVSRPRAIDQRHTNESEEKHRKSKGIGDDQTVVILDSSDEEEHEQKMGEGIESGGNRGSDDDDDKTSAVSWSDSGASEYDDDDDDPEELEIPERIVAVLLSDSFLRDEHGDHLSGSMPKAVFNPGDHVQVSKAVLLYEEPADQKPVLTCLGIPGRTKFQIKAAPPRSDKQKAFRTRDATTPKIEQKRREVSVDLNEQHFEGSRKRARTSHEAEVVRFQTETGRVKKVRLRAIGRERSSTPLLALKLQQDRVRDLGPLELLVRETTHDSSRDESEYHDRRRSDNLVYFATLWSKMPFATATPAASRSVTPASYASPTTEEASGSDRINNHTIITQHICWLTKIRSALIRAICATCENDYRNLNCTFGCPSRKWRLEIRMECYISDGTAEVQLLHIRGRHPREYGNGRDG